jgi:hypothetical protein
MDNGSSSGDEYGDTYDEHSAVYRAEPKLKAPPPGLTEMEGQLQQWRSTRYRGWREGQNDAVEMSLRAALLRLALASLLQPRLAEDAPAETAGLPGDVVGVVGAAVGSAQLRAWLESEAAAAGGHRRRALLQGAAAVRMLPYARNRRTHSPCVYAPAPYADLQRTDPPPPRPF